jgi:hypothetical protein
MERAKAVAYAINGSFWTSEQFPQTVFGIRLYNSQPYVNFDYPYQLALSFYSPGPGYLADTKQQQGGVGLNGVIAYANEGWKGELSADGNTIVWNGTLGSRPVYWNRVQNVPMISTNDQYSASSVMKMDDVLSRRLWDEMKSTYPANYGR